MKSERTLEFKAVSRDRNDGGILLYLFLEHFNSVNSMYLIHYYI